jgi:hypothetical protein
MQFLRTLFWVVLAVVAVIFAVNNWSQVTINLWGGMQADAKLPVLLLGAVDAAAPSPVATPSLPGDPIAPVAMPTAYTPPSAIPPVSG